MSPAARSPMAAELLRLADALRARAEYAESRATADTPIRTLTARRRLLVAAARYRQSADFHELRAHHELRRLAEQATLDL